MSNWIRCLIFSIVFSCLDATKPQNSFQKAFNDVKDVPKKLTTKPGREELFRLGHSEDKAFYVIVTIYYIECDKVVKIECAGTLIYSRAVLTAASCFSGSDSFSFLDPDPEFLKVTDVYVKGTKFKDPPGNDFDWRSPVERVDVYRDDQRTLNGKYGSGGLVEVAHLHLNSQLPPISPLKLCEGGSLPTNIPLQGKRVYTIGLACPEQTSIRKKRVPLKWWKIEMDVSMKSWVTCGNDQNVKEKGYDPYNNYCAVGKKFMPTTPDNERGNDISPYLHDNFDNICENRGGPVFRVDEQGLPECLLGVVNGVTKKTSQDLIFTKDDWFEGIFFRRLESFPHWTDFKGNHHYSQKTIYKSDE